MWKGFLWRRWYLGYGNRKEVPVNALRGEILPLFGIFRIPRSRISKPVLFARHHGWFKYFRLIFNKIISLRTMWSCSKVIKLINSPRLVIVRFQIENQYQISNIERHRIELAKYSGMVRFNGKSGDVSQIFSLNPASVNLRTEQKIRKN